MIATGLGWKLWEFAGVGAKMMEVFCASNDASCVCYTASENQELL